jgi:hypothetical protein
MAAALAAAAAFAGPPRLDALVMSEKKGGGHQTTFAPRTPKIFLTGNLLEAPQGTKVKSVWHAEKTVAAPPNYVIDSAEVTVGAGKNPRIDFWMVKPNAGWPVGDYRVDLLVNGKKTTEVKFKVK